MRRALRRAVVAHGGCHVAARADRGSPQPSAVAWSARLRRRIETWKVAGRRCCENRGLPLPLRTGRLELRMSLSDEQTRGQRFKRVIQKTLHGVGLHVGRYPPVESLAYHIKTVLR